VMGVHQKAWDASGIIGKCLEASDRTFNQAGGQW
jgi:hypothetical protein